MKATKKILSLVLALMMVLSSVAVLAETTPCTTHEKTKEIDNKPATCTDEGVITYWCGVCETTWFETKPALTHKWGTTPVTTPATCIANAIEHYVCENDPSHTKDVELEGTAKGETNHRWSKVADTEKSKPATCKDTGLEVGAEYCPRCKSYRNSYEDELPVLEHEWEGYFAGVTEDENGKEWCTDAAVSAGEHKDEKTGSTVVVTVKPATCTADGSVTVTCKLCGASETMPIKALGHEDEEDAIKGQTKEPTCTEAGYVVYTCSRDNYSWKAEVLATGHNFEDEDTWTYTQNGKTVLVPGACSDYTITKACANGCGATKTEEVKATKGAKHNSELIYEDKPATCLEDGLGIYRCRACGYTYSDVIKAAGEHTEKLVKLVKAPTCTESGEKIMGCEKCDATWTVTMPAVGHKWGKESVGKGSCTQKSYTKKTCTVCGEVEKVEGDYNHPKEKVTVVFTQWPTCTADGYQTIKCSKCGQEDTLKTATINGVSLKKADAHDYENEDGTTNMTTLQEGNVCLVDKIEAPKCVNCGYVDEEHKVVTEARGEHGDVDDFHKVVVVEATCKDGGKDGLVRYMCPDCKEPVEVTVPAPQHDWAVTESKTEKGSYVLTCNNCGETKEIEETKPVVKVDSSKLSSDNYVIITGVTAEDVANGLWLRVTWSYKLANGDSVAFVQACRAEMDGNDVIVEIVDPQIDGILEFRSAYVTTTSRSASKRVASITKLASVADLK